MSDAIQFPAEIIKVQTTADGAFRITLDIPADKVDIAAKLMEAKQRGAILEVAAVAVLQARTGEHGKVSERPVGKSEWSPPKE